MFGFSPSLEHFCRILGSCGVEATQPEFPDLEPVFAPDHTSTALSSQSSSMKRSVKARPGRMNHQKSIRRRAEGHHLHDKTAVLKQRGSCSVTPCGTHDAAPLFAHIQFGLKGANYRGGEIRGQIAVYRDDGDDDEN